MIVTSQVALGTVFGLSVAVPIGPMGLLCIQRTLSSGLRVGVCTGLGAATVNVLYGAAIRDRTGRSPAGRRRPCAGDPGGMFLLWSGARTLMQQRAPAG